MQGWTVSPPPSSAPPSALDCCSKHRRHQHAAAAALWYTCWRKWSPLIPLIPTSVSVVRHVMSSHKKGISNTGNALGIVQRKRPEECVFVPGYGIEMEVRKRGTDVTSSLGCFFLRRKADREPCWLKLTGLSWAAIYLSPRVLFTWNAPSLFFFSSLTSLLSDCFHQCHKITFVLYFWSVFAVFSHQPQCNPASS